MGSRVHDPPGSEADPGTKGQKTYRGIDASGADVLKVCFDKGGTKRPPEFTAANAGAVSLVLKRE